MRPSTALFIFFATGVLLFGWSLLDAGARQFAAGPRLAATAALVTRYQLTDLALFTEARYTRHLSQADHHAPFQDHPAALEHFPSGSMTVPAPWRLQ